jgi:phosphotransferase system HPr (HPr) family protein
MDTAIPGAAPEVVRAFKILNKNGIHARPAALLVDTASRYSCEIELENDGIFASAKSILSVMTIEACPGATVTVRAKGADAQRAMDALALLFEQGFSDDKVDGSEEDIDTFGE